MSATMVVLTAISIYPLKSARGIALREARLGDRGLELDRRFMLVDERGLMLTQRVLPSMARITTALEGDELALGYEGDALRVPLRPSGGEPRRVRVFGDEVAAIDLGGAARRFFSDALGRAASLVYMPDDARRQVDPSRAAPDDIVSFADGFPYLLTNESSLEALNRELPAPVPMARFRPNFVVAGLPAWAEDATGEVHIGEARFAALKPSSRCVIINTDPETGERRQGVLETLGRVHALDRKPLFGQNLVARGSGRVAVGDPVRFGATRA